MKTFALLDCNNFFVSCERVFNPRLRNRPVGVLSNNDGCVIARSKELKALGVPMGAPAFLYKDLFRQHDVVLCSSNFALYGDMSHRVMSVLQNMTSELQVYSIDEAFLLLDTHDIERQCRHIRETVLQWTGIPVSVGAAPTKTLAKVANHEAKKREHLQGVCALLDQALWNPLLDCLPVSEVWGIGSRITDSLAKFGIRTALQFCQLEEEWIKKHYTIVGQRIAMELKGISCLELEEATPAKKSIMTSRSFGRPVNELKELEEAAAAYASRAAEKLRSQNSVAANIDIFLISQEGSRMAHTPLPQATDYTPTLIQHAKKALATLFQEGKVYKKVAVLLTGLSKKSSFQRDLFSTSVDIDKQQTAMHVIDSLNRKFGPQTVLFAAEGIDRPWRARRNQCSPRYTTCWDEILSIR